jgi:ABC-type transport system involved in multi-copper enzyme maturation permease subunit
MSSPTRQSIRALRAFSLRRRLHGWHKLPNLAVAAIPVLIAAVAASVDSGDPYKLYGEFIVPMCIYFVIPFISMFTMLPVLGELYDNTAIGYLYTRPTPRWAPLMGLFQGGYLAMLPALALAAIVPGLILALAGQDLPTGLWLKRIAGLIGVLWMGGLAYGAICLFLGVWSRRAIVWAVVLLIGWGVVFGGLPGAMRNTSPHRYLLGLARQWCGVENTWTGMFVPDPDPPSALLSIVVIAAATAIFFLLTRWAANRRDVL